MLGRQISAGELVRKERALRQSNQCETSYLSHNLGENVGQGDLVRSYFPD